MRRLSSLLRGLPAEALTQRHEDSLVWTATEELMALLLEEVSLLTSQRTRPEPLDVPRPESFKAAVARRIAADGGLPATDRVQIGPERELSDVPQLRPDGGVTAVGHRAVLALMSGQGAVVVKGGSDG